MSEYANSVRKSAERRSGRPNRGRSRGRGRGVGQAHGAGSKKAFAGPDMDYDLLDDLESDDVWSTDHRNNACRLEQKSERQFRRGGGCSEQAPVYRQTMRRGSPVRVPMQHLHMTTENQEMVKDMLKDLHGEQVDISSEDEYEELDAMYENQYWMPARMLNIEEVCINQETVVQDGTSIVAVNKLSRYGFERDMCTEALQLFDGDIGQALEYSICQYFHIPKNDNVCNIEKLGVDEESNFQKIYEERKDEMTALQSIYEDRFVERIPNRVWVLTLSLPHLDKLVKVSPRKVRDSSSTNYGKYNPRKDKSLCKFFLQGPCRFGARCKFKHSVLAKDDLLSAQDDTDNGEEVRKYELEIRFPVGNKYPQEMPIVALSTDDFYFQHQICLNITKKLLEEARSLSESGIPVVFSLVSLLEDESVLCDLIKQPTRPFTSLLSEEKPWMERKPLLDEDKHRQDVQFVTKEVEKLTEEEEGKAEIAMANIVENESKIKQRHEEEEEEESIDPVVKVQRSSSKEDKPVKKVNPTERLKQNRKLKDEFRKRLSFSAYKSMLAERQKLPAWEKQKEILELIEKHQVLVVSGMTGCGKTTQIPQFILDSYLKSSDQDICNIICTQPRRISAMAVAERVAEERADRLGRIVGYQIRLEKVQSNLTRLLFCTTGIVLRRLEGDPTLEGITHIIMDEVHERSEESDFLLMYLRDMLPKRPDLKVIMMSATLNSDLFSNYFNGCSVIDIPGRTFPVQQYFLEDIIEITEFVVDENSPYARPFKEMKSVLKDINSKEDYDGMLDLKSDKSKLPSDKAQDQSLTVKQLYIRYSEYSKLTVKNMAFMDHTKINYDLIVQLLEWIVQEKQPDEEFPEAGAILVFLPGYAEIQTLYDMLQANSLFGFHRNKAKFRIIPLHSTLSSQEQHAVFTRPPEGVRKIVIATNIAETSITIDDIVWVIDSGKMKEKRYDQSKGMESLETIWVSRANALQRMGRAGRVQEGVCFHLFTGHRFEHHLQDQPVPEIQRAPLEQIVLRIRMMDIFKTVDVEEVLNKLIEPPEGMSILAAILRLQDLGALDEKGELTPLGYHLGSLPVDVRIGKLMLLGAMFRCLDSALTIAACLSFKSPFVAPFGKKDKATVKKREFAVGNSDHLTMLSAYRKWQDVRRVSSYAAYSFCQENFLSQRTLEMIASMKQQFVELLSDIGFVREGLSVRDVEMAAREDGTDGVARATGMANVNSHNWKLVAAILVGALYPNVVQVLSPESKYSQSSAGSVPKAPKSEELKFKIKTDGYVNIHPSSVNYQVRYYESPYLVFHEKVKTSKVFIRDCTMVSVYPLLLFGGGNISLDLHKGNYVLSVDDGWIRFMASSHQVAELVKDLRFEVDQLMNDKIENPHMDLCTSLRGSKIIDTIVKLISTQ
ncbi:hypothetical protein ACJMK2_037719 [Sinanodonta woodiana]|uniref:Putative ATP-dependent RNA helicase DHX57 n=2 Tax=Sinanodonta woodiana TaxID=1069815 RepID=A0ABD3WPT2_SINWO